MALPKPRRSGGPRTPAGRQAVAFNAVKWGAYAKTRLLPGESWDDWQALNDDLIKCFAPANAMEAMLVTELAQVMWKKRRLDRALDDVLQANLDMPIDEAVWHATLQDELKIPKEHAIYIETALSMSEAELTECLLLDHRLPPEEKDWMPIIHDEYKNEKSFVYKSIQQVLNAMDQRCTFDVCASVTVGEVRAIAWVARHKAQLSSIRQGILAQRTLASMQAFAANRAQDDLNRHLFRTLAELRNFIQWRWTGEMHSANQTDSQ